MSLTPPPDSAPAAAGLSRRVKILLGAAGIVTLLAPALIYPWFGARRLSPTRSPSELPPPYTLPPDFLWGTATAAYQVENTQNDDWADFEREVLKHRRFEQLAPGQAKSGHIHNLGDYPPEVLAKKTDFDARMDSDLALAAKMKHNSYRFSISWSRLYPTAEQTEPDAAGLAYYQHLFDALERHHLTPMVTLFHFASPSWLWQERGGKRGWERDDALMHFERFVRAVVQHFGLTVRQFERVESRTV